MLLTAPANVTLSCGNNSMVTAAPVGLMKLKLPLVRDCNVTSSIARGTNVTTFAPAGFQFKTQPSSYNFNAFTAAQ
jgi:glucan endo-1,3-alpha-glucosidase